MEKLNLDFNIPTNARRFLRGLKMPDGTRILHVITVEGKEVPFDLCSDDQACQFASQLYVELYEPSQKTVAPYLFEEEDFH